MVDHRNTRRRVRKHPSLNANTSTAATEREGYHNRHTQSCNDDDYNNNDDDFDNDNYHYRSEIQIGADDESGHKNTDTHQSSTFARRYKQRSRQRRSKRKNRRSEKEPPFLLLFFQVGAILFVLSFTSFYVCRGIYRFINPTSNAMADDNYEYEYAGDYSDSELVPDQTENDSDTDSLPGSVHSISDPKPKRQQEREQEKPKLSDLLHVAEDRGKSTTERTRKTMPPLPIFDLSDSSEWDAFGIVHKLMENDVGTESENNIESQSNSKEKARTRQSFQEAVQDLRARFVELYGGENAARMLLDLGMTTFSTSSSTGAKDDTHNTIGGQVAVPSDVIATACRLHRAKAENRSFSMAFGGYSVTAGRGNKHSDSFPFQLKEILEPILVAAGFSNTTKAALLVTNAAIGGVPSFPYGWCMSEFWGGGHNSDGTTNANQVPDVVSWDFGMNEASGEPEGLEAYVRYLLSTYSSSRLPPKLIIKDYFIASKRKEVIGEYLSLLKDPIILHTDHAIGTMFKATKTVASDTDEESDLRRPPGFRKWREWGAPKGAPGQAAHHPAVQEHKLNAWLLAMHFVVAIEFMVDMEHSHTSSSRNWCHTRMDHVGTPSPKDYPFGASLPPPKSRKISNNTELPYDGIFFGYPTATGTKKDGQSSSMIQEEEVSPSSESTWKMNPVFCRTTFEPTVSGDLSEIVVNGTIGEDLDPTLPKSQYYYNRGWTFALSEAERKAKRKLNLYPDGLGFNDSKQAYYGIYESPPMTLHLPYERNEMIDRTALSSSLPRIGDPASEWYESIVLCQVNDKNTFDSAFVDASSCNFGKDVRVRIGGVNILQNTTKMLRMIGSVYLGKPICMHVPIPPEANLTSASTLLQEQDGRLSSSSRIVMERQRSTKKTQLTSVDQTGLLVEIFVSNPKIVHVHQACSLSHVVWEQRRIVDLGPRVHHTA